MPRKKSTAKSKKPDVQLPPANLVILEPIKDDLKINHKDRISIVLNDIKCPATYSLRTKNIDVSGEKGSYAIGSGSRKGETGLISSKTAIEAVVQIALSLGITELGVPHSENSVDIKNALRKRTLHLNQKIQVS